MSVLDKGLWKISRINSKKCFYSSFYGAWLPSDLKFVRRISFVSIKLTKPTWLILTSVLSIIISETKSELHNPRVVLQYDIAGHECTGSSVVTSATLEYLWNSRRLPLW